MKFFILIFKESLLHFLLLKLKRVILKAFTHDLEYATYIENGVVYKIVLCP